MTFRKALFWMHLVVGCLVGVVVLMMSVTGVLLTYEQQVIAWAERGYHEAPPSGAQPMSPAELIERLAREDEEPPSSVVWESDPSAPVAVSWGRSKTVYANAYDGEVVGQGAQGVRAFFRGAVVWHRWFAAEGENRAFWKGVTGVSNLGFLFLVLTGMYLWLPKIWSPKHFGAVLWFRGGLEGKARDFNWHNVFGIWCAVPLVFVVATAAFFSYQWPSRWLYQALDGGPPASSSRGAGSGEGETSPDPDAYRGLDRLLAKVRLEHPDWRTISLSVPRDMVSPVSFSVAGGGRGRPDLRVGLKLDRETAAVVAVERFSEQSTGRRARTWIRWIHTGEAGGWIGQTIAGLASFGAVMLVWTGITLSWRRYSAWRIRRS